MAQQTEKNNMTAVEWYAKKSYSITLDFLKKKLNESEFIVQQTATLVKAQQLEKEQMIDFAEKYSFNLTSTSAEGFYNETYGKE